MIRDASAYACYFPKPATEEQIDQIIDKALDYWLKDACCITAGWPVTLKFVSIKFHNNTMRALENDRVWAGIMRSCDGKYDIMLENPISSDPLNWIIKITPLV